MSRTNFTNNENNRSLDELITEYAMNKAELDSYKKICDAENAEIKSQMLSIGVSEYSTQNYIAKRIVVNHESLNEDKLLEVLHKYNIPDIIETKEYVNMDAFESYLYSTDIPPEMAADFAQCKTTSQVVQLRVTRRKEK